MKNTTRIAAALIGAEIAMAGLFGAFGVLHTNTTAYADTLPVCANEDGNVDGSPCMWTDPDTGRAFYVNSENYR